MPRQSFQMYIPVDVLLFPFSSGAWELQGKKQQEEGDGNEWGMEGDGRGTPQGSAAGLEEGVPVGQGAAGCLGRTGGGLTEDRLPRKRLLAGVEGLGEPREALGGPVGGFGITSWPCCVPGPSSARAACRLRGGVWGAPHTCVPNNCV